MLQLEVATLPFEPILFRFRIRIKQDYQISSTSDPEIQSEESGVGDGVVPSLPWRRLLGNGAWAFGQTKLLTRA